MFIRNHLIKELLMLLTRILMNPGPSLKKNVEKKVDDEGNEIPEEGPAPIGNIGDIISDSKVW